MLFSAHSSTLRDATLLVLTAAVIGTSSANASAPEDSAPTDKKAGASLKASLKYVDGSKGEIPSWSDIRVTIVRDDRQLALDQPLPTSANVSYHATPKLKAIDLDNDAEPEVLIDVYTAGFERQRRTVVYRKDGNAYRADVTDWGTGGYRLANVVGKKDVEFLSADSRVPALFDSTVRGPLRVMAYDGGKLTDVSRQARSELVRDAKRHRRELARARRTSKDPRPELAAYAIDLVRIGQVAKAQAEIRASGRRDELRGSAKSFARKLDRTMVKWGYAKRKVLAGGL